MTELPKDLLTSAFFFPSAVYRINKPEFLEAGRAVASEFLAHSPGTGSDVYPICQTRNLSDARVKDLQDYIGNTCWNLLNEQGFDMRGLHTTVLGLWAQSFDKHGNHVEHIHAGGAQMSGFYFLDVPENSSRPLIFDPRPGKRQINLDQQDMAAASYASDSINFMVEPGDLMIMNSWLGHGFMPNASDQPFRFIHFNVGVIPAPDHTCDVDHEIPMAPEVI